MVTRLGIVPLAGVVVAAGVIALAAGYLVGPGPIDDERAANAMRSGY